MSDKAAQRQEKVNAAMEKIVGTVIEAMENGTAPWQMPWHQRGVMPTNLRTGNQYQGGNAFWLWILGQQYGCDYWVGFKQAKDLGGSVRKGEKGTEILRPLTKSFENDQGERVTYATGFAITYVWNVTQCDGIEAPTSELEERKLDATKLDAFMANTGADIRHGGDRAFYNPGNDYVQLPDRDQFKSEGGYYGTALHELVHWTGHKSRLDRLSDRSKRGYAFEELIAELGAFYASEAIGCPNEAENHASYLEGWLKALQSDPKYLWDAASKAQRAANWLIGLANDNNEKAAA